MVLWGSKSCDLYYLKLIKTIIFDLKKYVARLVSEGSYPLTIPHDPVAQPQDQDPGRIKDVIFR